jgi:hypothetical protein
VLRNILSCDWEIAKSAAVNSYGIFHPKGPNFLLSRINAWKKERPKNIFFHYFGFSHSSKEAAF